MRFGHAIRRFIDCILDVDPDLGPAYLRKVDIADTYMHI